jgi:predicted MFS family arabinose efflux permease
MVFILYRIAELVQSKPLIASLALLTHYVLHSDEWDNSIHIFLGIWGVSFGTIAAIEYVVDPRAQTVGSAIHVTITVAAIYFGSLIASVLLHRGLFHRLRKVSLQHTPYRVVLH